MVTILFLGGSEWSQPTAHVLIRRNMGWSWVPGPHGGFEATNPRFSAPLYKVERMMEWSGWYIFSAAWDYTEGTDATLEAGLDTKTHFDVMRPRTAQCV